MTRLGLLIVFVVTLSAPLMAQAPTGTIAGTVTDQVGAVIPHATVTITNKDTGASRVVQRGVDGTFSVPSLPAGPYDVLIVEAGVSAGREPGHSDDGVDHDRQGDARG